MEIIALLVFALAIAGAMTLGNTRTLARRFILLAIGLLALPVTVDVLAKAMDLASSAGLEVLLYWPFDFAYAGFAIACFTLLGWLGADKSQKMALRGAAVGVTLGAAWFIVAFFVVLQVHIMGGGSL